MSGLSLRRILARLTAEGMRTARGKEMSPIALAKILRNPFYVGHVRHQGELLLGQQVAIVRRNVFDLVQLKSGRR